MRQVLERAAQRARHHAHARLEVAVLGVAVQVEFKAQMFKPGYRITDSRVETR
jgi:hypothetical protein